MAGIQTRRQRQPLLEAELNEGWIVASIFFTAKGQVFVRSFSADNQVPVLFVDDLLKLVRTFSSGVEATDQTAHAGSSDVINRDVVLLKPLQDTNVGQTQGAAAFEGDTNFCARGFRLRGGGVNGSGRRSDVHFLRSSERRCERD